MKRNVDKTAIVIIAGVFSMLFVFTLVSNMNMSYDNMDLESQVRQEKAKNTSLERYAKSMDKLRKEAWTYARAFGDMHTVPATPRNKVMIDSLLALDFSDPEIFKSANLAIAALCDTTSHPNHHWRK